MISCLGQQNIDETNPYGFESRTLPHYNKFDDSPEARGFIENSYISGLTVGELFFHAMAGRTGLIDTAIKTVKRGISRDGLSKPLKTSP
jgi:DNA-directed RNA polymerase II subunit RPB1